jgi:hypothetical protein
LGVIKILHHPLNQQFVVDRGGGHFDLHGKHHLTSDSIFAEKAKISKAE